eukprot:8844338-Pyramimonas_sp.AAC.1
MRMSQPPQAPGMGQPGGLHGGPGGGGPRPELRLALLSGGDARLVEGGRGRRRANRPAEGPCSIRAFVPLEETYP